MADEQDFRKATRRILFPTDRKIQLIPGSGKSAAESPDRHVKTKVTMNLDGDIINHFKQWAKQDGRAYQSLINQVLREFVEGSRPERLAKQVSDSLLSDQSFLEEIAKRLAEKK